MFTRSARFYDALYHFVDYGAAASRLRDLVRARVPDATSLLDVCCGTGKHLEFFRVDFEAEGVDINGELLDAARRRCPDVTFHQADMRSFQLSRRFDVVMCLFSSIGYAETLDDMRRAVRAMAGHVVPGGLLIVEPWFGPDSYWTDTVTTNHYDSADLKICWMYTSKRQGQVGVLGMHYLVGTPSGVEHVTEEHRLGLFTRAEYEGAMRDAGLDVEFDPEGPSRRGLYIGQMSSTRFLTS